MTSRAADVSSAIRDRRRRPLVVVVAAGALAAVFVVAGRWEEERQIEAQVHGMEQVARAVGSLDQPSLTGYRTLPQLDCLVYRRGRNPYALELCVDGAGRLIEAIDRRRPERRYWSLRAQPLESPLRVDRAEVDRLLRRLGAKTP